METDDQWNDAWAEALDDLELTLERAQELLRSSTPVSLPDWQPPQLGPLPYSQVPRARQLLDRHLEVAQQVALAATATRRQLVLAARVSGTVPDESPIYLDITA